MKPRLKRSFEIKAGWLPETALYTGMKCWVLAAVTLTYDNDFTGMLHLTLFNFSVSLGYVGERPF
jgi:hypothetical protein